jgi:uncharacterized protein (TIRG00374 family)
VKNRLQTALRFLVSFGLLGLLAFLFRRQLGTCVATIQQADGRYLLLAGITYLIFILISAWRWQILLRAQQLHFSTWYLARIFTIGLFFCKLLPTSIGGDVMRIAYTIKPGKGPQAFSATFLDRLIGFQSLTLLAIVMGIIISARQAGALNLGTGQFTGTGVVLLLVVLLLLLVGITLIFFNDTCHRVARRLLDSMSRKITVLGRITDIVNRAYEAVKNYRQQPVALGISFLSGIGVQAALALAWFFTARAVGARVAAGYYLIFIPILNIVVNIPTIGGLGVREAAFVLFFSPPWLPNRLTPEQALSTALLFLGLDLLFAIFGGVLFAFTKRAPGKTKEE